MKFKTRTIYLSRRNNKNAIFEINKSPITKTTTNKKKKKTVKHIKKSIKALN